MSLSIDVGVLADLNEHDPEGAEWLRESLAAANALLAEEGLPQHQEPEQLELPQSRASVLSFPYSYIHYLRRFYAHLLDAPDKMPVPVKNGSDPTKDRITKDAFFMFRSHLICHSDCEGFYLPVDFSETLVSDDLDGGFLCSSYTLRNELIQIVAALQIQLADGNLSDEEAARVNQCEGEPYEIEKIVWISLFEAARLSIDHKTAIVFT